MDSHVLYTCVCHLKDEVCVSLWNPHGGYDLASPSQCGHDGLADVLRPAHLESDFFRRSVKYITTTWAKRICTCLAPRRTGADLNGSSFASLEEPCRHKSKFTRPRHLSWFT